MSQNLVPISKSQLPAHLRKGSELARTVATELSGGVTSSFPIISYRGKVWRVRKGGEEINYVDRKGQPIQNIDLVFVKSNPRPSKTFYKGKYKEGDSSPPTCWSSDGIKPDLGVQEKQHSACASCPRNAWGSRITDEGKKGRECSDVRRMAVVFHNELLKKGADAHVFLLRIPPASLNPLKDYADKALGPAGLEYFAVATNVSFDVNAAHPKLEFRVATDDEENPLFLDEESYEIVQKLRESEEVTRILSEEPDYVAAGTTGAEDAAGHPQNEAPAPAAAPKKQRSRPVDEEDVEVEPAPKKAAAPTVEEDEDEDEEPAPAPAPAPKVAKKKAVKPSAPAEDDDGVDETPARAAPPAGKGKFDDILESLLSK